MKRQFLITLALLVAVLVACGDLEDEQSMAPLQEQLSVSAKLVNFTKIKGVKIPVTLQQVLLSISDEEGRLFSTDSNSEFPISTVINIYIGAKFVNYSGVHNVKINTYLPDGNIFRSKSVDIDFSSTSYYKLNGMIVEIESLSATIRDAIPIAGTEIAILNITGEYKVELLLDQKVVSVSNFILK